MTQRPDGKSGFTLIELLIVIAIILILIAIALPNFLEAQARAKVTREKSDMRTIAIAIEALRTERNVLLVDFWDDDESRITQNRFGAGNCISTGSFAQEFPSFWACCCWHGGDRRGGTTGVFTPLTTPVPYLTAVPIDPFGFEATDPALVPDDQLSPLSYMYHDREYADWKFMNLSPAEDFRGVHGCYRGGCPPGLHGIKGPLGMDHYVMLGLGPDGVRSHGEPTPYAPTNGTRSFGDTTYRSEGGV